MAHFKQQGAIHLVSAELRNQKKVKKSCGDSDTGGSDRTERHGPPKTVCGGQGGGSEDKALP